MAKIAIDQSWWTKPKRVVLLVFGLTTGLAALIAAVKTITNEVGLGAGPPRISLQVAGSSVSSPGVYLVGVDFQKTGQGVLHNCSFSAWIEGFQMTTDSPMKTFTIPDGDFKQSSGVFVSLPVAFAVVVSFGELVLSCDNASSPSVRYRLPVKGRRDN